MSGGTEVQMVGYAGYADIHNLTPAHFNDHTNIADKNMRLPYYRIVWQSPVIMVLQHSF